MIRFAFKKGLRFFEGTVQWTMMRRLPTGTIQLESDSGDVKVIELKEINRFWIKGDWVIDENSIGEGSEVLCLATPRDLSMYAQRDQEIARYRYSYVAGVEKALGRFTSSPEKLRAAIQQIGQDLQDPDIPAPATVYRWWRRYASTRCITRLVDRRGYSGRKKCPRLFAVFEEAVAEVYLTLQKRPVRDVVDAMKTKVSRINASSSGTETLSCPGSATIYRWVNELEQDLVTSARLGKKVARRNYRMALRPLKVADILERIEIDHTPLDLILIDKETTLPLGRPWLTLAIDRYSRMIMGFYISFHAPSSFSVLQCLKRAILPKDDWLVRFPDVKGMWPARGIPTLIACDNGMDLHSDAFEAICLEMGVEIQYCPAGKPELKGAVERIFRTMNKGLIHSLPGTVFSNVDERGDYPAEKAAAIDLETCVHLITKWIVEIYHLTPHRALNMAPLAKWLEREDRRVIELPAYPQQLEILVGIPATRTLFHYGVEVDGIRYNGVELRPIMARSDKPPVVRLKYYEDDVGYIHIYDDVTEDYLRVSAVHNDYAAGLSRHVHSLIKAHAKKRYGDRYSDDQLLASKAEIQEIVGNALKDKKMANRKKSAIARRDNSDDVLANRSADIDDAYKTAGKSVQIEAASFVDEDLPTFGISTSSSAGD